MKGKEKNQLRQLRENSGTRDAVETAIDRSKEDKFNTWEGANSKPSKKIGQWQVKGSNNRREKHASRPCSLKRVIRLAVIAMPKLPPSCRARL